jgi:protein SCO1/2
MNSIMFPTIFSLACEKLGPRAADGSGIINVAIAGGADKFNILFITIDPEHDGPKEVGQYATLFNTPIIGLTGSGAQIDAVKKQFGIFAEPTPHAGMGKEMEHTATVLLFDRDGNFMGTVTPNEGDTDALATLKALVA